MEKIGHFNSLDELIRALDRERTLLKDMFAKRKTLSFRYELARELAVRKEESLDFLRNHGVIRVNGDFVELEEVYLRFFEEVLEVNEEINVASVKQHIDNLNSAIEFYLIETSPSRKQKYLGDAKKFLTNMAMSILRSVIDLKRNIDSTYKNEPTLAVKKKKLEKLDEKRRDIAVFIHECEKIIDEKQPSFFQVAMDVQLRDIVVDVKYKLHEAYHNLIELDRQIINYLNQIEYQGRLVQKIQKLKYLRDQLVLESHTDVLGMLVARNPVWLEPRPRYQFKVSLSMLKNSDMGLALLRGIAKGRGQRLSRGNLAEPLAAQDLCQKAEEIPMVDVSEVKAAFFASSDHLFHFVLNYANYRKPMDDEELLVLFCQIATQYLDELQVSDKYQVYGKFEYPLIYPKHALH
ncbi:MAG: hypothetical protein MJ202_07115 [Lentisphaeria bacterium]|nr:hypothetical protein [Lentisphaeria bacterium]